MPRKNVKSLSVLAEQIVEPSVALSADRCANCKYWRGNTPADGSKSDAGECRRHAPRPTMEFPDGRITLERRDEASRLVIWATTEPSDWCGEFSAMPA